ncbi:MAG: hypothetical protein J6W19_09110 [Prevotella sp.]|nr:hypothetical protein [Prevotella sp.]
MEKPTKTGFLRFLLVFFCFPQDREAVKTSNEENERNYHHSHNFGRAV